MAGDLGPCRLYAGPTFNAKGCSRSRFTDRAALAEALGRPVVGSVLHRCDNPPCCEPTHLYEGDARQNFADLRERGRPAGRFTGVTHCVHGHEFTPSNTAWKRNSRCAGGFERVCRKCRHRRNSELAARRKAQRAARKAGV